MEDKEDIPDNYIHRFGDKYGGQEEGGDGELSQKTSDGITALFAAMFFMAAGAAFTTMRAEGHIGIGEIELSVSKESMKMPKYRVRKKKNKTKEIE